MISRSRREHLGIVATVSAVVLIVAGTASGEGTFFKTKRAANAPAPVAAAPAPVAAPAPAPPVAVVAPSPAPVVPPPAPPTAPAEAPTPPRKSSAAPTEMAPPPPRQPPRAAPQPVVGNVDQVITTDTLIVAGQRVRLAGVRGEAGMVAGLQRWLASSGNNVDCQPVGAAYRCVTSTGKDIGEVVVMNGGGKADAGAPPGYLAAEAQARAASKGVWGRR